MLKLTDITIGYGSKKIITNVSETFTPGEVVGLVAPNGTGKSTLLNAIMGQVSLKQGQIEFKQSLTYKNQHSRRKIYRLVSMMPDQNDLYPELTGWRHLKMYRGIWKAKGIDLKQLVKRLNMSHYVYQKVGSYSLGMKQRLCFAMQIACDTEIMLMDEVMNGLDPNNVELISGLIDEKRQEGKTIIIASHLLENLSEYADRIFFIDNAQLELFRDKRRQDESIYLKLSTEDFDTHAFNVDLSSVLRIDQFVLIDVTDADYRKLLLEECERYDIILYTIQHMELQDAYKIKFENQN
ncbi:ATP-binding cassette domain-containing protein [Vagococcus vulneris]|uniref:ABC transporter domain-containing protein n=1 Tax=Vagococcus vulneris TaxID=1977869 RepID=A0A430A246_9ENTE|nr:ABC transporter ATP-binding protein [Vagococcus vulneris]RSU00495.1 hypothetical protein CBF37_00335 [Vagococcus vulneris]